MVLNSYGISSSEYAKLYNVWKNMISRCYDENSKSFLNYGARGIAVCSEWKENKDNFFLWSLNNGWKPGITIERKNVNGNYCPENCCFVPKNKQFENKTDTVFVSYKGETKPLFVWCKELGLNYQSVLTRRWRGTTSPEELFSPVKCNRVEPNYSHIGKFDVYGVLIEKYSSSSEAAKNNGFDRDCIKRACNKKRKTYKGFVWNYLDEKENVIL